MNGNYNIVTGSVRKVKTKKGTHYQLIIECGYDQLTGKRIRSFKTVNGTEKEAKAELRRLISEVEKGKTLKQSPVVFLDWVNQWVTLYKKPYIEETTMIGYRNKIHCYIEDSIGKMKIKDIKPATVQALVNSMIDRGLSPKSIRDTYNIINGAMKKAVVQHMISYNPCEGIELPRQHKYQANVYDVCTIQTVLEKAKADDEKYNSNIYIPILLLAELGLRRGELLALRWENIDLKNGIVKICENMVRGSDGYHIKKPKTDSGLRDIHIGADLINILTEEHKKYVADMLSYGVGFDTRGYIVRQANGSPLHPDSMSRKWERFLERNMLPKIRLHDLRHSNATALIQAGVSPKVVQQRLGHADITTTLNTYTHVLPSMDITAAETLDNLILKKA